MPDRYDTSKTAEGQFQPGSNETVLVNKLGITNSAVMDKAELDALHEFEHKLLEEIEIDQSLRSADLCDWHRRWLGGIYPWAGQYRSVNMQKGDFLFAAAHLIPGLMAEIDKQVLSKNTPCQHMQDDQLIEALAVSHVELVIIHPFREGNGRLMRLLATVMALQAGKPLLDFTYLADHKEDYIHAIHAGHAGDMQPMKTLFEIILRDSQQESA